MRSTMRRFLAVLFALFTSGMCAYAATDLPLGQVTTGTISLAAQMDSYSFTGTAGEVVDLTMTPTSGTLAPKIQLLSPGGTLLGSACKSGPQELNTITLTSTGTYTVTASDCSGTNTGNYALFLQSINSPVSPITLPVAQVQTGAIGSAALDNTYTFSASANDVVDFTAVTTSGSMSPRIRLYSATGALLSDQANRYGDGVCSGGSVVELNTVTLTASGTYTVLVGDCSDTNTGAYNLYMQRPENPTGPINLPFGQVTTGTIGSAGLDNTYTFSANANDVVDFTAVATGGNLSPRIRLYSPTGVLLSDQANRYGDGVCSGGSAVELNAVALAASGTYTVVVGDCVDTSTGSYTLTSQCSRANSTGKCTDPSFLPNTKYFHGTETLSWAPPTVATVSVSASLTLSGPVAQILGKNLPPSLSMSWDTKTVPDGNYQLTLTFLDANGNIIASALKQVLINNSVVWHSGTVTTSQTWSSSSVHAIDANLIIPSGVTVTIQPGTIVKVVPGVGITVQSGGILNALGANGEPIIFTSIEDSTVGGDTMLDGGIDNPTLSLIHI